MPWGGRWENLITWRTDKTLEHKITTVIFWKWGYYSLILDQTWFWLSFIANITMMSIILNYFLIFLPFFFFGNVISLVFSLFTCLVIKRYSTGNIEQTLAKIIIKEMRLRALKAQFVTISLIYIIKVF